MDFWSLILPMIFTIFSKHTHLHNFERSLHQLKLTGGQIDQKKRSVDSLIAASFAVLFYRIMVKFYIQCDQINSSPFLTLSLCSDYPNYFLVNYLQSH